MIVDIATFHSCLTALCNQIDSANPVPIDSIFDLPNMKKTMCVGSILNYEEVYRVNESYWIGFDNILRSVEVWPAMFNWSVLLECRGGQFVAIRMRDNDNMNSMFFCHSNGDVTYVITVGELEFAYRCKSVKRTIKLALGGAVFCIPPLFINTADQTSVESIRGALMSLDIAIRSSCNDIGTISMDASIDPTSGLVIINVSRCFVAEVHSEFVRYKDIQDENAVANIEEITLQLRKLFRRRNKQN